jgi:hypothetical protein
MLHHPLTNIPQVKKSLQLTTHTGLSIKTLGPGADYLMLGPL